jgi:hypothetical protein
MKLTDLNWSFQLELAVNKIHMPSVYSIYLDSAKFGEVNISFTGS